VPFPWLWSQGGAGALAGGTDGAWGLPLGAMVLALRHLGLSGFEPAECMAVEQELGAWQRLGGLQHRPEALRLKASLLRAQRLAGAYSQLLLDTLAGPAAALGGALGVGEERSAGESVPGRMAGGAGRGAAHALRRLRRSPHPPTHSGL
jgi:phosphoglucan,water dikinase